VTSCHRRLGSAAAVAAVALTVGNLAGCSIVSDASVKVPAVPVGVVSGGTLRIGIVTPSSIDPAQAYDRDGELVVSAMCDPLVEVDPRTGLPFAGLTKHIVQESNGTGVTMTLKDGLRFADGTTASVPDVRASLSRVASDTLASPLADEVKVIGGFPLVHGDVPVKNENDPNRTTLAGAVQVTNHVVTIATSPADSELAAHLARPWTAVVPAAASQHAGFATNPVCVGPYRLARPWRPTDKTITLVRAKGKPVADEAFTGGGRGYPDSIVFRLYDNEEQAFAAWLRGDVDVARVPTDKLGVATVGGRVVTAAEPAVEYIGMPAHVAPFNQPAVRRAFSLSLDRQALIATLHRPDRVAASSFLPTTLPAGLAARPTCTGFAPAAGDVPAARQLLAAAGVKLAGRVVPFYVNDEPGTGNRQMVQAAAEQWRKAFGIVPKIVPLTWDSYLQQAQGTKGFDGPFRTSWSSPVVAPSAWLQPLLLATNIPKTNLTRFSNPYVDASYVRAVSEQNDPVLRFRNESSYANAGCLSMPLVPVWEGTESFVVRSNVGSATGHYQSATSGDLLVRELYVKP
jgi:oligopeptide transport system substrate-binding protein